MRNRYSKFSICLVFALVSALSLMAQSDRGDVQQKAGDSGQPLLTASLADGPATGGASHEAELPDAPSAARPEASGGEPTPVPVVKSTHGAPPAAMGGPLGVDGGVADRKYWAMTGTMFSASIMNAELTLNCLQVHASCNDVPSAFHSRAALYGVGIPADLGIAYLTYYMKKKHNRIWYVPAAAVTAANLFLGVRAYRWSQDK